MAARPRPRALRRGDRRGRPRRLPTRPPPRGHHPGARVLARGGVAARRRPRGPRRLRPRVPVRTRRQGPRRGPRPRRPGMIDGDPGGAAYIAAAFAGHGRRAALMPYLMGGFPDVAASRAIGEACVDAGGDLLELGVPYSDPLADGPVIHAAGSQALRAGTAVKGVDRKSTRLNSSHANISYAVFCLKKKKFLLNTRYTST